MCRLRPSISPYVTVINAVSRWYSIFLPDVLMDDDSMQQLAISYCTMENQGWGTQCTEPICVQTEVDGHHDRKINRRELFFRIAPIVPQKWFTGTIN